MKREPIKQVAAQFDLPESAIKGHQPHAAPPREHFDGDPESLLRHLLELDELAASRLAGATEAKAVAALIGERRRIALDMARLQKTHEHCPSVSKLNEAFDAIRRALLPFPEAREAVVRALGELDSERERKKDR
jgi:hypothetical protein